MANTGPGLRYLVFRVGSVSLAVALPEVLRVLRPVPVTRVPHAPGCLDGVVNLEHEIVPVLRLSCALGLGPGAGESRATRVVLLDVGGEPLGLYVDGVNAILTLPDDMRAPALEAFAGIDGAMLAGLCDVGAGEPVAILNVPEVLSRAFVQPLETS